MAPPPGARTAPAAMVIPTAVPAGMPDSEGPGIRPSRPGILRGGARLPGPAPGGWPPRAGTLP